MASQSAVAIAPAPLEVLLTTDVPEKLNSVVIRTVEDDVLVPAIEILSFANKRPGHAAYLTLMRPLVVKGYTSPESGFFVFFPLYYSWRSGPLATCSGFISLCWYTNVAAPNTY